MLHRLFALCITALLVAPALSADESGFVPFPVDWKTAADSPADLSSLLQAPAGGDGRVTIADGHFVRGNGKRLRLWGVNVSMAAGMPAKANAPLIAQRLAQAGVNCLRFHFMDIPAPRGLLDVTGNDTSKLNEANLDRLDFFIAELKKRGIYSDINLNVGRAYKPGDNVPDAELLGYAKALTYFDPHLIELQKQYARLLLTHRNPYTQSQYIDEPAVALVELVNENSLVESWYSGRLLGKNTTKNPGTWTDIPASYEKQLTELFNVWLKTRLSAQELADLRTEAAVAADSLIPRLQPKEFAKASTLRFQTEATFYIQTEQNYFRDMSQFLHADLGVKALLVGSSDHNHSKSGYPHLSSTSLLDVVDGHVYWQHPSDVKDPATGRKIGFKIDNTPMVLDPLRSTVVQLARSAIAGKPYIVSEVNHPFPAENACEGLPILSAYAAFQDWDGLFWYTLGHKDVADGDPIQIGHFDLFTDPVKMAQLRAGALMFLRGDIAPAKQVVARSYTRQQVIESLRLPYSQSPLFTPGLDGATALTHAIRIQSLDAAAPAPAASPTADPIASDTTQLTWLRPAGKQGLVTINTPRCQALIGHSSAFTQVLPNLQPKIQTPFCAITLSSLDDKPIASSPRLLLTSCARVANTGMQWDAKRTTLIQWGKAPACIEPVTGSVTLGNLQGATAVSVQPLDAAGHAMGQPIPAAKTDAGWTLPLGTPPTTWYVISVQR